MKKIKIFINQRKVASIVIAILVCGFVYIAYGKIFSKAGESSYLVSNVKKGTIISTVTGTGQISASRQIDIKSKVSGDLVFLNTNANGTEVKKGDLIAQVNTRDALISLKNAQIAYQKLVKPADEATALQSENALSDAITAHNRSYDDAFNTVASTFSDLPSIVSGLNDMLYSQNGYLTTEQARQVSPTASDYQTKAGLSFDKAKVNYEGLFIQYKNLSRLSSSSTIENFVANTYLLAKDVSEAVKNAQNALNYIVKAKNDGSGATQSASIASWTSTVNSDLANLVSAKNNIVSTAQSVDQKNADLHKLETGPDSLDIASQKLNLEQAQNTYEDYFIRAPFDGVLARLSVKATDSVNSGTVIGTIVSSQKISTITLNEVDVEKVHVGQKAKLTFDAVDGLTIDGTVTTVDLVGTVTSGVVNYNVEIVLDTNDNRIKSGMSVTAAIITDTKEDVLTVPNSAIKTVGNFSFVQVFPIPLTVVRGPSGTPSSMTPQQKKVTIGSSNDTLTEITSGLNEGDQVITRVITSTTAKTTATGSLFPTGGTRTGTGGGNFRTGGTGGAGGARN